MTIQRTNDGRCRFVEAKQDHNTLVSRFYFAYGSNLCLGQMQERCPGSEPLRSHRLPGYRLVLRGVANIEPETGAEVHGAIYAITDADERTLDTFEGFPTLYKKGTFTVQIAEADEEVTFYELVARRYKPAREGYVEIIRTGFRDWELPEESLERAVQDAQDRGDL